MHRPRRALPTLLLALAASTALPAAATAGTYVVRSCAIDAGQFGNRAWTDASTLLGANGRYTRDSGCVGPGDPLEAAVASGPPGAPQVYAPGAAARLRFTAPAATTIVDYALDLNFRWYAPPTERGYVTLAIDGDDEGFVAGGGDVPPARAGLASEGDWYSDYGDGNNSFERRVTLRPADSAVQRRFLPARRLSIQAGCWKGQAEDCPLGRFTEDQPPGASSVQLFGARVVLRDDRDPVLAGPIAGQGLLAPGARTGDEPVVLDATDNAGIRLAELVDADTGAVLGAEDYGAGARTDKGTACDFGRPRPCPNLDDETIRASSPIVGRRTLAVRVTDAAGTRVQSAPFSVGGRGPLNGSPAAERAALTAGFVRTLVRRRNGRTTRTVEVRASRTVGFGTAAKVTGRLVTDGGQPIAGARVDVFTRVARLGSGFVASPAITTGPDGGFALRLAPGPSRNVRLEYRTRVGDAEAVARDAVTLVVRGRVSLRSSRARVRPRGRVTFSGRLTGDPMPPGGVALDLQAFQPGRGWRTVGGVRTRPDGRYAKVYRFNSGRGGFAFRVRLRPNASYPYARTVTRSVRVRVG